MTTETDAVNKALLLLGIPKRISSLSQDSLEAQTANLIIHDIRDELLRLAPWQCARGFANLTWLCSAPGTPENPSTSSSGWVPGLPLPPWTYEYAYPADCLRALSIVPQTDTGAGGVPIYPTSTMTGYAAIGEGAPVRFDVGNDSFFTPSRVILTNQQNAVLAYVRQVTDPNNMDSLFFKAWYHTLAASLCMVLIGDKNMANGLIAIANNCITEARAVDGNEALTVMDSTPDWLRCRGFASSGAWNMGTGFSWDSIGLWMGY